MKYYVVMSGCYDKKTKKVCYESCEGVYTDYCQALGKAMLLFNEEIEERKHPGMYITPMYALEAEAGDGMDLIDKAVPYVDYMHIYYCTMEEPIK